MFLIEEKLVVFSLSPIGFAASISSRKCHNNIGRNNDRKTYIFNRIKYIRCTSDSVNLGFMK